MTNKRKRELIEEFLEKEECRDFPELRLKNLFCKYRVAYFNNDFEEVSNVLDQIEHIYDTGNIHAD